MTAIAVALDALINARRDLLEVEAADACNEIMSGEATQAQTASLLTALRLKGETVEEITGFARTMRSHALRVELPGVARVADTAGTGGDGQHTFNVSTAAAFVCIT